MVENHRHFSKWMVGNGSTDNEKGDQIFTLEPKIYDLVHPCWVAATAAFTEPPQEIQAVSAIF